MGKKLVGLTFMSLVFAYAGLFLVVVAPAYSNEFSLGRQVKGPLLLKTWLFQAWLGHVPFPGFATILTKLGVIGDMILRGTSVPTADLRDIMCDPMVTLVATKGCSGANWLHFGSVIFMMCVVMAFSLHVTGFFCVLHHWRTSNRKGVGKAMYVSLAKKMFFFAAAMIAGGFAIISIGQWKFFTSMNLALFSSGIRNDPGFAAGWFAMLVVVLLMFVPLFLFPTTKRVKNSRGEDVEVSLEDDIEDSEEEYQDEHLAGAEAGFQKHRAMAMANYGAAGMASAHALAGVQRASHINAQQQMHMQAAGYGNANVHAAAKAVAGGKKGKGRK